MKTEAECPAIYGFLRGILPTLAVDLIRAFQFIRAVRLRQPVDAFTLAEMTDEASEFGKLPAKGSEDPSHYPLRVQWLAMYLEGVAEAENEAEELPLRAPARSASASLAGFSPPARVNTAAKGQKPQNQACFSYEKAPMVRRSA